MCNARGYYGRYPSLERDFQGVQPRVAAAEDLVYVLSEVLRSSGGVCRARKGAEASVADTLLEHINHQSRPRQVQIHIFGYI
jgi:hypothetical protein